MHTIVGECAIHGHMGPHKRRMNCQEWRPLDPPAPDFKGPYYCSECKGQLTPNPMEGHDNSWCHFEGSPTCKLRDKFGYYRSKTAIHASDLSVPSAEAGETQHTNRHGEPCSKECGEGRHSECTETLQTCNCTFRGGHRTPHRYMNAPVVSESGVQPVREIYEPETTQCLRAAIEWNDEYKRINNLAGGNPYWVDWAKKLLAYKPVSNERAGAKEVMPSDGSGTIPEAIPTRRAVEGEHRASTVTSAERAGAADKICPTCQMPILRVEAVSESTGQPQLRLAASQPSSPVTAEFQWDTCDYTKKPCLDSEQLCQCGACQLFATKVRAALRAQGQGQRGIDWLHSHCTAIGMNEEADSKLPVDAICLFTIRLKQRAETAERELERVKGERDHFQQMHYEWMRVLSALPCNFKDFTPAMYGSPKTMFEVINSRLRELEEGLRQIIKFNSEKGYGSGRGYTIAEAERLLKGGKEA